jgi:hypothetical protein
VGGTTPPRLKKRRHEKKREKSRRRCLAVPSELGRRARDGPAPGAPPALRRVLGDATEDGLRRCDGLVRATRRRRRGRVALVTATALRPPPPACLWSTRRRRRAATLARAYVGARKTK